MAKNDVASLLEMGIEGGLNLLAEFKSTKAAEGHMVGDLPWLLLALVGMDQLAAAISQLNAMSPVGDWDENDPKCFKQCFLDGIHYINELKEILNLLDFTLASAIDLWTYKKGEIV
jgi:hypothetical protein